ncbi:MAG: branched-chain amino acid ABC transporter permease [Candidatus Tectimicrobiota bacterium]|nr:MAG: branched-chain amino acid ABC transporter permease [Candidatus Tectomicrobia bacterium]
MPVEKLARQEEARAGVAAPLQRASAYGVWLLLLAFVLVPFVVPRTMLLAQIVIFALFAIAFDLLFGHTGILSFGHAAYLGVGAYTAALFVTYAPVDSMLLTLAAVLVVSAALAALIGFFSIQLRGIYLAMVTLAFAQVLFFIANQVETLTGGEDGLPFWRPALLGWDMNDNLAFYFFVLAVFAVSFAFLHRLVRTPFGSVLHAIRENEERARMVGYNTQVYKLCCFVISGALSGLAGGLFAMLLRFSYLDLLYWTTSGDVVMMTLIGGMGSLFGPVLGAAFMLTLQDLFSAYWDRWRLIVGVIFILVVLFLKGGIWQGLQLLAGRLGRPQEAESAAVAD